MNKQRPKTTRRSQINVAKNWALTIMLIALAFAHFSSELLLKEQMIIPVKKNVKQRWSYRRKIDRFQGNLPTKIQRNWLLFTDCFLTKFPPKFPVKSADFSKNLPLKILQNLTFFCKNPAEFCFFFREISEALAHQNVFGAS